MKVKLQNGFRDLALRLQEAATALSHSDIRSRISDALRDAQEPGSYGYIVDIFGDDQSGDVVYSCNGDLMRCPYEISAVGGKAVCTLDTDSAVDVYPVTTYEEEADEQDHMAAMEAACGPDAEYAELPTYERFISKSERDAADSSDFAGKSKSFPILKPSDIMAAVHAMGRAGAGNLGPSGLKGRIISIAKRKGWQKYLPKQWQGGGSSTPANESRGIEITGDISPLVELREGNMREAAVGADGIARLRLIAPGWGSSGYYSPALLERDGPKVFTAGTKMYWNHQTAAEEASRPEGDLRNLASEILETARYDAAGPVGPGLYAPCKVFEHYRQAVNELAPHIGVSIRASGTARPGEAEGRKGMIIERLERANSVDYVTQAGAGGKILQLFEAARTASTANSQQEGGSTMDPATLTRLEESNRALAAQNSKLAQRLSLFEARDVIACKLDAVRLPDAAKERLTRRLTEAAPLTAEGALDTAKLDTLIETEIKDEAAYLTQLSGGRIVVGMGAAPPPTPEQQTQTREAEQKRYDDAMNSVGRQLGLSEKGLQVFRGGREEVA